VIGIGTDLVDIDRMRDVLARTPGMIDRLFCSGEQAYAETSADPARPYAARFAAKEAVLKSLGLGLGGMRFIEIEVVRFADGHPELVLHGEAADVAKTHGAGRFLISLSHTDTLAQAMVVALAS
jgi:holo-[acyl-carrier protein] synthase